MFTAAAATGHPRRQSITKTTGSDQSINNNNNDNNDNNNHNGAHHALAPLDRRRRRLERRVVVEAQRLLEACVAEAGVPRGVEVQGDREARLDVGRVDDLDLCLDC